MKSQFKGISLHWHKDWDKQQNLTWINLKFGPLNNNLSFTLNLRSTDKLKWKTHFLLQNEDYLRCQWFTVNLSIYFQEVGVFVHTSASQFKPICRRFTLIYLCLCLFPLVGVKGQG